MFRSPSTLFPPVWSKLSAVFSGRLHRLFVKRSHGESFLSKVCGLFHMKFSSILSHKPLLLRQHIFGFAESVSRRGPYSPLLALGASWRKKKNRPGYVSQRRRRGVEESGRVVLSVVLRTPRVWEGLPQLAAVCGSTYLPSDVHLLKLSFFLTS